MKYLFVLLVFLSTRALAQTDTTRAQMDTVRDGSSYEKAVIVDATNETAGVHAEYQWLRDHMPDYDTKKQVLMSRKGTPYDILTVRNQNGIIKTVYFDIAKFYGRM